MINLKLCDKNNIYIVEAFRSNPVFPEGQIKYVELSGNWEIALEEWSRMALHLLKHNFRNNLVIKKVNVKEVT